MFRRILRAILIACIALAIGAPTAAMRVHAQPSALAAQPEEKVLSRPVLLTLQLASERHPMRCSLLAWSEQGLRVRAQGEDDDRVILWWDLKPQSAYTVRRRFLNRNDARGWLELGVLMLEMRDARLADRAFGVALRIDPTLKDKAAKARSLAEAGEDPANALRVDAKEEQTEARDKNNAGKRVGKSPARPTDRAQWTLDTDAQRKSALTEVRQHNRELFVAAKMQPMHPVETKRFFVYSGMAPSETRDVVRPLDAMYDTLLRALEIPEGTELYHGKCTVFIFNTRERFLRFEELAFKFDAAQAAGVFHPDGPWTTIVYYKSGSQEAFMSTLAHEATHSFLYRYRTARALPTWASEGLADYVAGYVNAQSSEPNANWTRAKQFVIQGGDVVDIMQQNYRDGSWPQEFSYPVSHMLVRFLLKHKPKEFKQWIDDIKAGKLWRSALEERFGVSVETLAKGFADAIRREPAYNRYNK